MLACNSWLVTLTPKYNPLLVKLSFQCNCFTFVRVQVLSHVALFIMTKRYVNIWSLALYCLIQKTMKAINNFLLFLVQDCSPSHRRLHTYRYMLTSLLYRLIWKTIKAINSFCHSDLSISFPQSVEVVKKAATGLSLAISKEGCIRNCAAGVDGYHLQAITSAITEVRNHVHSFYSWHYRSHGVNITGACDHHCCFVFFGVAGPGIMGDCDAIKQVELHDLIKTLPGLYSVIGDCAYTPSEKLIPICGDADATLPRYDNFHVFASQLRKRFAMAFGCPAFVHQNETHQECKW